MRVPPLLALVLIGAGFTASPALGQGDPYTLTPGSQLEFGCLDPSPCDCLAELVGPATGGFTLVPILPPLGPIFEYTVIDVDITVISAVDPPISITGSGLYTIDLVTQLQTMSLDLLVDGVAKTFTSTGAVAGGAGFPAGFEIAVFHDIDGCLFDGLRLFAEALPRFLRGDGNEDGTVDLADAIRMLGFIIPGLAPPPICDDSMDANDDGQLNIADPIATLTWLFASGPPLPAPFPDCGTDPTPDGLSCTTVPLCP